MLDAITSKRLDRRDDLSDDIIDIEENRVLSKSSSCVSFDLSFRVAEELNEVRKQVFLVKVLPEVLSKL